LKMRLSSGWIGGIWKRPKEVCKLCHSRGRAWKVDDPCTAHIHYSMTTNACTETPYGWSVAQ
jgi:hypothetical protein